ncbi:MAG: ComEC/Rec2 family competence protein [Paludibacteraceae bacterium]|nr:ComEC/Rec2 family competence protein [Paludibacteraceae bacterium]
MERLRKIPFVILLLPLIAAIIVYYSLIYRENDIAAEAEAVWQAELLQMPQIREKTVRAEAWLVWRSDSTGMEKRGEHVLLYIRRDTLSEQLKAGDRLLFYGAVSHSNKGNPYEFDYDKWLRIHGIAGVVFLDENEWLRVDSCDKRTLRVTAEMLRHRLVRLLKKSGLSDQESAIVAAMTVGEREELDAETRRKFSAAGAAHVLAVSGLHTGVVFAAVMFLLTGFGMFPVLYRQKWRRWAVNIAGICIIWVYAFLTGMSPSVMRAALMITLFYGADALGRRQVPLNTLAAAAFLNLIIEPQALFSVSFQLSYAAVLGILVFYKKIAGIVVFKHKLPRRMWQLLAVSVSAQLGTIPVTLWYFLQTSNWFALTNMFVIPLASLIIYFTAALVVLAPTPLKIVAQFPLKHCAFALNWIVGKIENLPGSTGNLSLTPPMLVLLILAIVLLGVWVYRLKWQWGVSVAAVLALLTVLHTVHLREIEKTEQTIVYNTYPYSLILHQEGRSCVLYTDSIEAALDVSEPLRKQMMTRQVRTVVLSDKEAASFVCGNRHFLYLAPWKGHKTVFKGDIPADVLLLGGRGNADVEEALQRTSAAQVIFLSALPRYRQQTYTVSVHNAVSIDNTSKGAIVVY